MIIIPAIDLLNRRCVRLYKGGYDDVTRYDLDPVETAVRYQAEGAVRIHIVDLDGAKGDPSVNRSIIGDIRKKVNVTLEVGGGIRCESDVKELINLGADRLIVGSVLATSPETVRGWVNKFGRRFLGGIDALKGIVKISGWRESGGIRDEELAKASKEYGIAGIIYTNIAKDGTMEGPAIQDTLRIARASGLPVVVSGGVGSEAHVAEASGHEKEGIAGVIVGKALYEGAVSLSRLIQTYQRVPDNYVW